MYSDQRVGITKELHLKVKRGIAALIRSASDMRSSEQTGWVQFNMDADYHGVMPVLRRAKLGCQ